MERVPERGEAIVVSHVQQRGQSGELFPAVATHCTTAKRGVLQIGEAQSLPIVQLHGLDPRVLEEAGQRDVRAE